ncbi:MAG: NAD(P)/FAD-dependent oxidoreductase [Elusimicrobia bacterium]|nr:NAD(P)/FAD-dependent oxidoreductase [Elusimicrobiota bacterium]
MFAAGKSAEANRKTLLLEKKDQPGRKLKITGSGRCNITNNGDINVFIKSYHKNGKFLYRAFSEFFNKGLIKFLNGYGIKTIVEKKGKIFPANGNADAISAVLVKFMKEKGVILRVNSSVEEIFAAEQKVKGVKLKDIQEIINCNKVIIATGGLSYPQTGSTGDGYLMAAKLGHTIVTPKPALVPLEVSGEICKELQGLSFQDIIINAFAGNKKIITQLGDMLFTHFGISGPAIFHISGLVAEHLNKNEKVTLAVNLISGISPVEFDGKLRKEIRNSGEKTLKTILSVHLPKRFVEALMKLADFAEDKKCKQLNKTEIGKTIDLITNFRLNITKTRPIEEATVTSGGVSLKEINPYTMESKIVRGLYFCGEVIDIDGLTGGFNLQAAFSTAFLAAKN